MACYHPLLSTFTIRPDGKKEIHFVKGGEIEYWEYTHPGKNFTDRKDFLPLPCGHCIGCRIEYSRQWANRLMLELQYHESSYFVTLTYDDEHLPYNWYSDPETGEAFQSATLVKRDFQLFMKRLRRSYGEKLRFFAAGEYGSQTHRPHYHAIIFGLKLDDLVPYKRSAQGFQYFNSEWLQNRWCDDYGKPIGYVVVAPVSWETCAYTARYVTKKLSGEEAKFYSDFNIVPEFSLMSRKPGIARQWYEDHPGCMVHDYINISAGDKGLKFKPPRYYDKLFDLDDPEAAKSRKDKNVDLAKKHAALRAAQTGLSYLEQLQVDETAFKERAAALVRNKI